MACLSYLGGLLSASKVEVDEDNYEEEGEEFEN